MRATFQVEEHQIMVFIVGLVHVLEGQALEGLLGGAGLLLLPEGAQRVRQDQVTLGVGSRGKGLLRQSGGLLGVPPPQGQLRQPRQGVVVAGKFCERRAVTRIGSVEIPGNILQVGNLDPQPCPVLGLARLGGS